MRGGRRRAVGRELVIVRFRRFAPCWPTPSTHSPSNMRIHISIPPELTSPYAASDPDESPLFARFGGDTVLIELQGQLESEGDTAGKLIGILGMEGVSCCPLYAAAAMSEG